jgi:tetratricopeptide (TPR) repeat protein
MIGIAGLLFLAGSGWLRLSSPNFELFTDGGEKNGRQLLSKLETTRQVFLESIGGKPTGLPVRVFLFESERGYRALQPPVGARAFYQSSAERDYIVLYNFGPETLRAVRHEYVHLMLNHSSGPLPRWLEEGIAEFYSTLEVEKGGGRTLVGLPIPDHLRVLAALKWLGAPEMAGGNRPEHGTERTGMFYAQSWALVHMMNLSPAYRRNMARFAELLDRSTPPLLAFEQAFGRTFEQALNELTVYVRQGRFTALNVMGPPGAAEPAVEVQAMTETTAALAELDLLLAMGRDELGTKRLAGLARSHPDSPEVLTASALLALHERRSDEAARLFAAAIEKKAASAVPYFESAMLRREAGAPRAEVRQLLAEAVGRNPDLAEGHFLIGLMLQQDGRHAEAVSAFEQAVRVLPRQSYFWHALALSQHQLGRGEQARRAALRAASAAATAEQLEMAQAAIRLTVGSGAPAAKPAEKKPDAVVPDSWKPREGDARAEGVLEHVDCFGMAARFQIRVASGAVVRLWVDKPGEVLLKTASSLTFDFSCGPQRPRRVVASYTARPDAARKTEGNIVSIEFR